MIFKIKNFLRYILYQKLYINQWLRVLRAQISGYILNLISQISEIKNENQKEYVIKNRRGMGRASLPATFLGGHDAVSIIPFFENISSNINFLKHFFCAEGFLLSEKNNRIIMHKR
jgi:hypothetical protein